MSFLSPKTQAGIFFSWIASGKGKPVCVSVHLCLAGARVTKGKKGRYIYPIYKIAWYCPQRDIWKQHKSFPGLSEFSQKDQGSEIPPKACSCLTGNDQLCPNAPDAVEGHGTMNGHRTGQYRAGTGPRRPPRGQGWACPVGTFEDV